MYEDQVLSEDTLASRDSFPDVDPEYAANQAAVTFAAEEARTAGLIVVEGTANTLLLDMDDGAEINGAVLEELAKQFGKFTMESWTSRNGHGKHYVICFEEEWGKFTPAEAIALEAALGSDPRRVLFYIERLHQHVEQPRMLFRPPTPEESGAGAEAEEYTVEDIAL